MGATPLQHRVAVGCFAAKLSSPSWNPSSSGKIRGGNACSVSSPFRGLLLVLFLLKLAAIATPIMANLGNTGHSPMLAPHCLANSDIVRVRAGLEEWGEMTKFKELNLVNNPSQKSTKSVIDVDHRNCSKVGGWKKNTKGRKDTMEMNELSGTLTVTSLRPDMSEVVASDSVKEVRIVEFG